MHRWIDADDQEQLKRITDMTALMAREGLLVRTGRGVYKLRDDSSARSHGRCTRSRTTASPRALVGRSPNVRRCARGPWRRTTSSDIRASQSGSEWDALRAGKFGTPGPPALSPLNGGTEAVARNVVSSPIWLKPRGDSDQHNPRVGVGPLNRDVVNRDVPIAVAYRSSDPQRSVFAPAVWRSDKARWPFRSFAAAARGARPLARARSRKTTRAHTTLRCDSGL